MNPPANWYPDPTGRHGQRYWDGDQWTEHVFTDGVQDVDPLDAPEPGSAEDAAGGDTSSEPGSEGERDAGDVWADDETPHGADAPATTGEPDDAEAAPADPDGLFSAARDDVDDAAASAAAEGDDADLWVPASADDPPASSTSQEDPTEVAPEVAPQVAPEVEPHDVVGALDEVEQTEDAEPAMPVAGGGLSDAFVLAPETASRLVAKRTRTPEDDHAEEPSEPSEPSEPGAIDAPPPAVPAGGPPAAADQAPPPAEMPTPTAGGLGITGELVGGAFAEREGHGPVVLQNTRMLRCAVAADQSVVARQGTMVAYQGDVQFERQGAGGVARALKRAATGEGMAMMRVEGSGDVFFADGAQHVFILQLEGGPGISVNGRNVLAFSGSLAWDIERVKGANLLAGGLFNTTLTGTGWVALVSDGQPVVLRTDEAPTFVDVNALVAWSGGLSTRIVSTVSAKSLVGLGSGEAFQMAFEGSGIVIVQPSEGVTGAVATA